MAELTYEDYKQRISIQDVLRDAGYTLNRRDGLRYPSYVRIGSDGARVRGDKFIVTANGQCCFQPPERKNYNIISFIKEHPQLFTDYIPGMDKDRLVNLVCHRLLNEPVEVREKKNLQPKGEPKQFGLDDYKLQVFDIRDWDSQKKFYPYFQKRGISLQTQRAFAGHFMLASQEKDGKVRTNLAFPLSTPKMPNTEVVGLEQRGKPDAEGRSFKGMAAGSDAQHGLWIARLRDGQSTEGFKPLSEARNVYWFESAFDAMAFYQINHKDYEESIHVLEQSQGEGNSRSEDMLKDYVKELEELDNSVFVSTGGNPTVAQIRGMLEETGKAHHHLCFDRDRAGQSFSFIFAMEKAGRVFTSHIAPNGQLVMTDMTNKFERYTLDLDDDCRMADSNYIRVCDILGLKNENLSYFPPNHPYKDWNDQLLDKPMEQAEKQEETETEEERPHFHR